MAYSNRNWRGHLRGFPIHALMVVMSPRVKSMSGRDRRFYDQQLQKAEQAYAAAGAGAC
jgi:hypothetical protein